MVVRKCRQSFYGSAKRALDPYLTDTSHLILSPVLEGIPTAPPSRKTQRSRSGPRKGSELKLTEPLALSRGVSMVLLAVALTELAALVAVLA